MQGASASNFESTEIEKQDGNIESLYISTMKFRVIFQTNIENQTKLIVHHLTVQFILTQMY